MIKNWLDESDILFFEGLYNMNWSKVFENIKKDPEEWVEEGGWSFLQLEVRIFHQQSIKINLNKIQI